MPFDPQTDIERLPNAPGVYLMRDVEGEIIYVGKAAQIRTRVRQYFGSSSDTRFFVRFLEEVLDSVEVLVTSNEKEALILENELIKRHQPRFNVLLKDDKSFLHLRIDDRVEWPRIQVVRRPRRDGARYFGPYHSAGKIRETLRLVERFFQLRNCDDLTFKNRSRPCLQYQIKRCPGPCVLPVDRSEYQQQTQEVMLFLQGKRDELARQLEAKMSTAAAQMAYEQAARYRDQLRAIRDSLEKQQMVDQRAIDRDVYGIYREGGLLQIVILQIRRGRLLGSQSYGFERQGTPDSDVLSTFINLYYSNGAPVPHEVLVPAQLNGMMVLGQHLEELAGRKTALKQPRRGASRRLLDLAAKNAEHAFFLARREETVRDGALVRLKKRLRLANLPIRIECFDISLFQGAEPVASKVVFEGGVPKRSDYRHYRIREVEGTDDYGMMREVLLRRLRRGLTEEDLPHLIVVDGGKGQLNVALAVVADLGIEGVDVVALAKSRVLHDDADPDGTPIRSSERVFLPNVREPIPLRAHTDELFVMTHLRDEAHRFAITFHRKRRKKAQFSSPLDGIEGVGPARRRALLRHFGSLRGVRAATVEELAGVSGVGPRLAQEIHEALKRARTRS